MRGRRSGTRGRADGPGGRMSEQPLDLKRSAQIVWRHKMVVGAIAALGCVAGVIVTMLNPPMLTSEALVVLPPSVSDTGTQALVASSDPVLIESLHNLHGTLSLHALRS